MPHIRRAATGGGNAPRLFEDVQPGNGRCYDDHAVDDASGRVVVPDLGWIVPAPTTLDRRPVDWRERLAAPRAPSQGQNHGGLRAGAYV